MLSLTLATFPSVYHPEQVDFLRKRPVLEPNLHQHRLKVRNKNTRCRKIFCDAATLGKEGQAEWFISHKTHKKRYVQTL